MLEARLSTSSANVQRRIDLQEAMSAVGSGDTRGSIESFFFLLKINEALGQPVALGGIGKVVERPGSVKRLTVDRQSRLLPCIGEVHRVVVVPGGAPRPMLVSLRRLLVLCGDSW